MVSVEVRAKHAQPRAGPLRQARNDAYIFKSDRPWFIRSQVAINPGGGPLHSLRSAKLHVAAGVVALNRFAVVQIINNDDIKPAVSVIIEKRRRRCPPRVFDPRAPRDVFEVAAAAIQEESRIAIFS